MQSAMFPSTLQVRATVTVDPVDKTKLSIEAARQVDVCSNRLFVELLPGFGYPWQ